MFDRFFKTGRFSDVPTHFRTIKSVGIKRDNATWPSNWSLDPAQCYVRSIVSILRSEKHQLSQTLHPIHILMYWCIGCVYIISIQYTNVLDALFHCPFWIKLASFADSLKDCKIGKYQLLKPWPNLTKIFSASIYSTLEFKHLNWLLKDISQFSAKLKF